MRLFNRQRGASTRAPVPPKLPPASGGLFDSIRRLCNKRSLNKLHLRHGPKQTGNTPPVDDKVHLSHGLNFSLPKAFGSNLKSSTKHLAQPLGPAISGNLSLSAFTPLPQESLLGLNSRDEKFSAYPDDGFQASTGHVNFLELDLRLDSFHSSSNDSEATGISPFDDKFSKSYLNSSWGSLTSFNTSAMDDLVKSPSEDNYYGTRRSRSSSLASTNPEYYGLSRKPSRRGSFLDIEIKEQMKNDSSQLSQWPSAQKRYGRALPSHYRCASSIYSNDDGSPVTSNIFGIIQNELRQDRTLKQRRMPDSTVKTTRSLSLTLHPNVNILDSPALGNPFTSDEYVTDGYISDIDVQEYKALVEPDEGYESKTDLLGKDKENERAIFYKYPSVDRSHMLNKPLDELKPGLSSINSQNCYLGGTNCDIKRGKVVIRRVNRSRSEDGTMLEIDEEEFDPMSKWRRKRNPGLGGSGNRVVSSSF